MKYINVSLDAYGYSTTSASYVHYDLAPDVVSPIKYQYGIVGIKPTDRVADIGTIKFSLNNNDGDYLPTSGSGWGRNAWIILNVTYYADLPQEMSSTRFIGKISDIQIKNPIGKLPVVEVTAVDAMNDFVNFPNPLQEILYSQTFYTGTEYLINLIPGDASLYWNPVNPRISDVYHYGMLGFETFLTICDTEEKATIFGEMNKMALSELGYAYLTFQNNKTNINVENRYYREDTDYTYFPMFSSDSGKIETEIPENLLQEDGYYLVLDEETYTSFSDNMTDYSVDYGSNIINQFSVKAYPRTIQSASSVLFNQEQMLEIMPYEYIYLKVTYSDPSGQSNRTAGSGISQYHEMWLDYGDPPYGDISGDLSVGFVDIDHNISSYGAFSSILRLYSSHPIDDGYITTLQLRGYAVSFYNPIESIQHDADSIELYGTYAETLDQKYKTDTADGTTYASEILAAESEPRKVLKSITFIPNVSTSLMSSYLYNDIGDKIHVEISDIGIDGDYFIQHIDTNIDISGVITAKWSLI